jgi:hypothetical protein
VQAEYDMMAKKNFNDVNHKDTGYTVSNLVVTMKNLNEYIASCLRNVFYPSKGDKFDFCDIMDMCCMPQHKFLQVGTNPFVLNGNLNTNPPGVDKNW